MFSKQLAVLAMSTALAGGGAALAQTESTGSNAASSAPTLSSPADSTAGGASSSSASAPAATPSSSTASAGAPAGNMQFVTDQQQGQFRASKFMGLDVYGTDNQKIGDIKEILIDQTGNAKTAIIGVGGFLGIGEKNVGVQWSALEWRMEKPASTSSAANTTTSPGAGSSAGNRPGAGDVTGSTATSTSNAGAGNAGSNRSPAESAAANGYPDHAVLRVTRQDVERAPTFRYYGEQRSNADRGSNAGANTNPPRQ